MENTQTKQIDEDVIEEVTTVVKRIDRTQLLSKKASLENIITKLQAELSGIEVQLDKFK
jgi:hypothetical protein